MGIIKDLIQTIVVIVVLAVFMEMLLPPGEMRRYLKTVMGLLIILAVLQAAATAINSGFLQDVTGVTGADGTTPPLDQIMVAGQKLAEADQDQAIQKYQQGVAQQVLALARLNQQLQAVDAVVTTGGQMQEIKTIKIIYIQDQTPLPMQAQTANEQKSVEIKDIRVEMSLPATNSAAREVVTPDPEQLKAADRIAQSVAQFYNLSPGQVQSEFVKSEKR